MESLEKWWQQERLCQSQSIYWQKKALNDKFSDKDDVALFHIAKQIRKQNQDIIGEKCVKDDDNKLAFSDTTRKNAWKQHYQRLRLNLQKVWLHLWQLIWCYHWYRKKKLVKSPGPSNIIAEIIKALPNHCSQLIAVLDAIVKGKVPEEWYKSYIVSLFKDKGSALDRGNYCGLKLTHQVLKLVKKSSESLSSLMICSLVSCLDVGRLILSSLWDNLKKSFWTKKPPLFSFHWFLKRLSIGHHVK